MSLHDLCISSPATCAASASVHLTDRADAVACLERGRLQMRCPNSFDVAGRGNAMPRYYFNIYDDGAAHIDLEGEDFSNKQLAWKEATVTAGQMIQSMNGKLLPGTEWRLEVTDEFANPLYVIHVIAEKPS
jgi:hypothetical protein